MLLTVTGLEAGYGEKQVLYGISLTIADREIVSLIGHNGAGKSTTLKSIVGLVPPRRGQILFADEDLTLAPPPSNSPGASTISPRSIFCSTTLR